MQKARLLLPFTYGMRMDALEYAVLMAQSRDAILVPLSLIKENGVKGTRLEDIQQSKDFLAAIDHKALKYGVEIEHKEVFTSNPVASIQECMQTMPCAGVLLLIENGKGVLLQTAEVKHVMATVSSQVHIIRMLPKEESMSASGFMARLMQMFSKGRVITSHA